MTEKERGVLREDIKTARHIGTTQDAKTNNEKEKYVYVGKSNIADDFEALMFYAKKNKF